MTKELELAYERKLEEIEERMKATQLLIDGIKETQTIASKDGYTTWGRQELMKENATMSDLIHERTDVRLNRERDRLLERIIERM